MALIVDIGITTARGGVQRIELLEIRRLEPLGDGDDHTSEVHNYVATSLTEEPGPGFRQRDVATLRHRYGDGARTLISNALAALGYPENKDIR